MLTLRIARHRKPPSCEVLKITFNLDDDWFKTQFLALLAGMSLLGSTSWEPAPSGASKPMYGLIGKMTAVSGKRAELAAILLEGLRDMLNCHSYIVANDPKEDEVLWITEVWQDSSAHLASLSLPSVQAAISKGRPLIAAMERVTETIPQGGTGL